MSLDAGTCEWLAGEIEQSHLLPLKSSNQS